MTPTYTDFSGFNTMRAEARVDPQASLKKVAKQFEGIFVQMMMKSMRDASMGDPIFDSDQSNLYRDMYDKQIALNMSEGKGIGLADALVRQLSGRDNPLNQPPANVSFTRPDSLSAEQNIGNKLPPREMNIRSAMPVVASSEIPTTDKGQIEKLRFNSPDDFTQYILPYAEEAAEELGVSPLVLVAQAALETGWGKAITRHQDGTSSFNLFNIKADNRWDGERVVKSTLEYDNGQAKYEKAAFRSYDSYADSFDDYVDFLRSNNRYGDALQHQGDSQLFIKGLHKAGYATDPNYSDKVLNIYERDELQTHANVQIDSEEVT